MTRARNPYVRLAWDAWMLGSESAGVIGLRAMKIAAGGPQAEREAKRMIDEKVEAAQALQVMALSGALGFTAPAFMNKTLKHYRRKVRANRRRLSKT
ncbi:hypothetical protein P7B02_02730 [Caulobacter segnis]|uniref:hypothetical protein n=1 Tax=Caulobacter segnis TaxID=88688 RepID=UPI00240ED021|nr:hypothetical protein [Caulobacter segnis]MDG2520443.1 hypothetical protein [Caulobacter segnis]